MFSVRRFGKGTKKLALTNHGQWIEDYVFDYFLKETEPDCSLYAKDGTEKKIHKVSDFYIPIPTCKKSYIKDHPWAESAHA